MNLCLGVVIFKGYLNSKELSVSQDATLQIADPGHTQPNFLQKYACNFIQFRLIEFLK